VPVDASNDTAIAEERLALAVEAARLGCWTWDMETGTTVWDARLEEMHGLPPGGFGGTFEDWVAALHPDDRDHSIAIVRNALANPGPYSLVHRTVWEDDSVHTIECRGTVLTDDEGRPTGNTGVAIDVTTRARREAAVGQALLEERHQVRVLQQTLLPTALPSAPGTTVAARYQAAETKAGIGGDWYAVIALPDGRLAVAIGDVAGHGLDAVADMAAARFSLRALALTDPAPEVVLDRLNQVVHVFEQDNMITALYGVLDPGARTWTYASAGHLPALVRARDGATCLLTEPPDPPLGVARSFRTRHVKLPDRATLVLYTDGLIERRSESLVEGLGRLQRVCSHGPTDPRALCDYLCDVLIGAGENEDDVAIVAVTLD
jgi:hypothetical protein